MKIEENITKESNLAEEDSLSCFQGHGAQQSHRAYRVFYDFLCTEKPARILEIGTALGGFTTFLRIVADECSPGMEIMSFDISDKSYYDEIRARNIDVRVQDVFGGDFKSVDQFVIDYIQKEGVTVVLCDGGWKVGEFNILSNYIKPGDYIMAHDYAPNREVFASDYDKKIWNWCEITDEDIKNACERNALLSYNRYGFNSAAWVCKTKL